MRASGFNWISFVRVAAVFFVMHHALSAQVWWEETGQAYDYDMSRQRILILLGDDFDYHETMVVKRLWEDWGAKVDMAGTEAELKGHLWKPTKKGWDRSEEKQIKTDMLLSQVKLSGYQALFFPGGNSPRSLLEEDSLRVVRLIQKAEKKGLVLAGICHGPHALAAAEVIQGRKVTGHHEIADMVRESGGEYVTEVCAVDGNIITGNWPYFETMAVKVAEKLLYPRGDGPSEKSPFNTNPVLNAIAERRSIREFLDVDVDQDTVKLLLRAASWAPSADNDQPWKFVVVKDREIKDQIQAAILDRMKGFYEARGYPLEAAGRYWSGIFSAPVHIFAFCDTSGIEIDKEWEKIDVLHCFQGVSVACQNILLAAHALGLGSLWAGATLIVEDEIKSLLEAPEEVQLVAVIAVGYPAYEPLPPVRKPLSDIMFTEKWGQD